MARLTTPKGPHANVFHGILVDIYQFLDAERTGAQACARNVPVCKTIGRGSTSLLSASDGRLARTMPSTQ